MEQQGRILAPLSPLIAPLGPQGCSSPSLNPPWRSLERGHLTKQLLEIPPPASFVDERPPELGEGGTAERHREKLGVSANHSPPPPPSLNTREAIRWAGGRKGRGVIYPNSTKQPPSITPSPCHPPPPPNTCSLSHRAPPSTSLMAVGSRSSSAQLLLRAHPALQGGVGLLGSMPTRGGRRENARGCFPAPPGSQVDPELLWECTPSLPPSVLPPSRFSPAPHQSSAPQRLKLGAWETPAPHQTSNICQRFWGGEGGGGICPGPSYSLHSQMGPSVCQCHHLPK